MPRDTIVTELQKALDTPEGRTVEEVLKAYNAKPHPGGGGSEEVLEKLDIIIAMIEPNDLTKIDDGILDFKYDPLTIIKGGLNTAKRRITA